MDLLLGVQGWRRYIFTDKVALETIKFHLDPELKAHGISLIGPTNCCPPQPILIRRNLMKNAEKGMNRRMMRMEEETERRPKKSSII